MKYFTLFVLVSGVVIQATATPLTLIQDSGKKISSSNDFEIAGKITGGTQVTNETKHPYQVLIESVTGLKCGGSIIAADVILTSGTCASEFRNFEIIAGDVDLEVTTGNEQVRKATSANVTIHPDYSYVIRIRNDVAFIKLDIPFDLNDYVNIIPLERENFSQNLHAGEEGTIVGWGMTSEISEHTPGVLYEAEGVLIITNENCVQAYGFPLDESIMCADTSNGKGLCTSDMGSPFVQENNGRLEQIGINSFYHSAGCNEGYPDGFTRVSMYIGWIESELGRPLV